MNKQFPINITITPGTISEYPMQAYEPGIVWTPTTWNKIVDIMGYKVIAKAGTMGSGNILVTMTKEMKTPIPKTIDI